MADALCPPPRGSVMVGAGSPEPARHEPAIFHLIGQCNIQISGGNPAGWRTANTRALTPKFQQRSLDYVSIYLYPQHPQPSFCWPESLVLLAFGVGGGNPNAPPMPPTWRSVGGISSHVRGQKGCLKLEPRKLDTGVQKA